MNILVWEFRTTNFSILNQWLIVWINWKKKLLFKFIKMLCLFFILKLILRFFRIDTNKYYPHIIIVLMLWLHFYIFHFLYKENWRNWKEIKITLYFSWKENESFHWNDYGECKHSIWSVHHSGHGKREIAAWCES